MKTNIQLEHGDTPNIIGLGIIRTMIRCYWQLTQRRVIAYKYFESHTRMDIK